MKKILLFAAVAAAALASCSKADNDQNVAAEGQAIEFRSVVDKTRASQVTTTDEFRSFFVQADIDGANTFAFLKSAAYKETAGWVYSPKKYWPTNTDKVSFFAYAPVKDANMKIDLARAAGVVTFGYTVPHDQSVVNTAVDLLVAHKTALDKTTPTVSFDFTHALSAATFSSVNQNAATSELTYVINKIEITNLNTVGTYTYDPAAWSAQGTPQTYVAGVAPSGAAVYPTGNPGTPAKLLSANDVMMVLPQTPVAASKVKITFSLKDGQGAYVFQNATREFSYPAAFEFVKGTCYNFTFTFQDASTDPNIVPIVLDVNSIEGWVNSDATVTNP